MSESVRAANAAFDELVRVGKTSEEERTTFLFGFVAGVTYSNYLLSKRITGHRKPPPFPSTHNELLKLESKL